VSNMSESLAIINGRKNSRIAVVVFYLMLLLIWQSLYWSRLFPHFVLPAPLQVLARLYELVNDGLLWTSCKATFSRIIIGYGLSALLGIAIGLLMGTQDLVNSCVRSLFLGLQTLPTAAWVPLSLLLFGLDDKGIYFVIVMSSLPAVAISTSAGIRRIPPLYLRVARTMGCSAYHMATRVILPAAFPSIVTGIKLGFTLAWHGAVSAELIKSTIGLGFLLAMGRELADAPQVLGIMLVTIVIGVTVDHFIFGSIERRVAKRWGLG
jgi:NitT/TauT family transport system permease protein